MSSLLELVTEYSKIYDEFPDTVISRKSLFLSREFKGLLSPFAQKCFDILTKQCRFILKLSYEQNSSDNGFHNVNLVMQMRNDTKKIFACFSLDDQEVCNIFIDVHITGVGHRQFRRWQTGAMEIDNCAVSEEYFLKRLSLAHLWYKRHARARNKC